MYKQDAFTYVRLHGRADFFITVTCNAKWPEIKALLSSGQTINDRHDIVARVFRQKLLKLIDSIKVYQLFGKIKCYLYTIEWQKRGLPHAHILIWLQTRIRPDQIDDVVCADKLVSKNSCRKRVRAWYAASCSLHVDPPR